MIQYYSGKGGQGGIDRMLKTIAVTMVASHIDREAGYFGKNVFLAT